MFVYGTLRNPEVQKRAFGRSERGIPDALPNYARSSVAIEGRPYAAIRRAQGGIVRGMVLSVNEKELERIDAYETSCYARVRVRLQSGKHAWTYVKHV